jgi:hypothetical protein
LGSVAASNFCGDRVGIVVEAAMVKVENGGREVMVWLKWVMRQGKRINGVLMPLFRITLGLSLQYRMF